MRIIAGEHRGRTILAPESDTTRPITDRVKQSLFDILTPLLDGAVIYDVFAGTGSMGLECLSRGASHAVFFEQDRSALKLLRKNIDTLKLSDRATIVPGDLFKLLSHPPRTPPANLLFLDPPYRFLTERADDLRTLAQNLANHTLAPGATISFRHDAADSLALPPLIPCDTRDYGSMTIELLRAP